MYGTVVYMNRTIYVIGGENEAGVLEKAVELIQYNSINSKYEVSNEIIEELREGRSKCSSIVFNNTIWVIGKCQPKIIILTQ